MDYGVQKFRAYVQEKFRYYGEIQELEARQLDLYLGEWMLSLHRADGADYEPDTLTAFHRCIDRYLRDVGYKFSLVSSAEFDLSRRVLQAKRKELKGKGMGNRPNRAKPLDDKVIDKLWAMGQLGLDTPESLLNLVWYNNTTLLGF